MAELTGIMKGNGAKMKADIQADHVVFRGALKEKVPFAKLQAEARGTLLALIYKDHVIEVSAGAKAGKLAMTINQG
jgi:hypothetical protein